jgi:TolA-binding protein
MSKVSIRDRIQAATTEQQLRNLQGELDRAEYMEQSTRRKCVYALKVRRSQLLSQEASKKPKVKRVKKRKSTYSEKPNA